MYNEQEMVQLMLDTLRQHLDGTGRRYEIVCVDDGSADNTRHKVDAIAEQDPRVVLVSLSRNFGKEAAMTAGMTAARGQAVLIMDADLQHPPELIERMLERWDEGYDVINAVKEARSKESLLYRALAHTFNRMMSRAIGTDFQGASDFKLLDRAVVDALLACPERNRFFRGMVAWVGFHTIDVPFTVAKRAAGQTQWSTAGLVRYSLKALIAFTALPLRLVAALGLLTLVGAVALAIQTLARYLMGLSVSGFTTVILLQLILGALMLMSMGVLSLYVAQLYEENKGRPVFIVRPNHASPGKRSPRRNKSP